MTPQPEPYIDLCRSTDWSAITTAGNWVPFLDKRQQRRVNQLAGGTLAYLAAASITAGLVLTSTSTGWKDPDTWVIHAAGWGALVLPLMVLLSAVGAIAHHVPAAAPASGGKQAPATGVPGARKPDETAGSQ